MFSYTPCRSIPSEYHLLQLWLFKDCICMYKKCPILRSGGGEPDRRIQAEQRSSESVGACSFETQRSGVWQWSPSCLSMQIPHLMHITHWSALWDFNLLIPATESLIALAQEILTSILNVSPHLLWRRHCHTVTPEVKTTAAVFKLILRPISVIIFWLQALHLINGSKGAKETLKDHEGLGLSGGTATQLVVCVFEL